MLNRAITSGNIVHWECITTTLIIHKNRVTFNMRMGSRCSFRIFYQAAIISAAAIMTNSFRYNRTMRIWRHVYHLRTSVLMHVFTSGRN